MNNQNVKVRLDGISAADRPLLKQSPCLLFIGIDQRYPKNSELRDVLNLIEQSFSECTILLADTLQRYPIGVDNQSVCQKELYELSLIKGKLWLNENMAVINRLSIPYKVSYWCEWLNNSEFNKFSFFVSELRKYDTEYRETLNTLVTTFIKDHERERSEYSINLLQRYICELTAVSCLAIHCGYKFTLCPTKYKSPITIACKKLIDPKIKYKTLGYSLETCSIDSTYAIDR